MGVRVASYANGRLVLEAPLTRNYNHLGTAFGGSLNALATLAGYTLVWLALDDPQCHVMIRESAISFKRPVTGVLMAVCLLPDEKVMAEFREKFAQTGKARLELRVTIEAEGRTAVEFRGTFVAVK